MLPSVLASQARAAIEEYLSATFPISSGHFSELWPDFFRRGKSLFRGPYYTLQLPFRHGGADYAFPSGITLGYSPYLHQEKAFQRLCGSRGASALVTTGTGSGKTECFLYPLLDHCLARSGEPGVKAIVVYPMNALATDQAKRFAREIHNRPELRGKIDVGLYIGGYAEKDEDKMTADSVITSRHALRDRPPSILLTNYKALDYLLVRARDYPLWRENEPGTLRYVVVDELHTFDGAQGADLACLLRRVYARLGVARSEVNCVGTSATLGSGSEDTARLVAFANAVFGGGFAPESVIAEDLLDPDEFLPKEGRARLKTLSEEDIDALDPNRHGTPEAYLAAQARLWLGQKYRFGAGDGEARVRLGEDLASLQSFQELLRAANGKTLDADALCDELGPAISVETNVDGRPVPVPLASRPKEERDRALESLFALVSYARRATKSEDVEDGGTDVYSPFLRVRVQLWLRELARMGASVLELPDDREAEEGPDAPERSAPTEEPKPPKLIFLADLNDADKDAQGYLPLVHCRSCGRVAYLSFQLKTSGRFSTNVQEIYRRFFANDLDVCYIYAPDKEDAPEQRNLPGAEDHVCPRCLTYDKSRRGGCRKCGALMTPVTIMTPNIKNNGGGKQERKCPYCGADEIAIVGQRAASLTSVVLSQLFGSKYNDDKKLIAFSDSVQDASHRAGFFVGRSFRFTLRAAIQQYVESLDAAPTLTQVADGFKDYWLQRFRDAEPADEQDPKQRLRAPFKFIVQFLAPQLQDWRYDVLKERWSEFPSEETSDLFEFEKEIENYLEFMQKRVRYEIVAEYARVSQIGRTLEKSRSSTAALKPELREKWIQALALELRESIGLRDVADLELKVGRWIVSFVRTLRVSGGVWMKELGPLFDEGNGFGVGRVYRYMPVFGKERSPRFVQIGSQFSRTHDVLAGGKRTREYQEILRAALGQRVADRGEDVYPLLVGTGVKLGILRKSDVAPTYALRPETLLVETDVDRIVNERTKRALATPASERQYWDGAVDWESGDSVFRRDASPETNYYRSFYASTDVCRIVSREHTGLLERGKREELENEFIAGVRANVAAVNVLSCTPTLEMGVNIGDLSCIALCSVPPTRASFVQRVGRGGRRDGNSFNLVVAENRPRDLYYFNEPEEAFSGAVDPPGVFLNAPAVLERQICAYSFDRWIEDACGTLAESEVQNLVPSVLKELFAQRKRNRERAFPNNFFAYVRERRDAIFDRFRAAFDADVVEETTWAALRVFFFNAEDGGFEWKFLNNIGKVEDLRDAYRREKIAVDRKIRERKKTKLIDRETEQELNALASESAALKKAAENIEEKTTYEYLTDEGLLPNYAFPEEGMTLRSALWRKKPKKEGKEQGTETISEEYGRAAKVAISELAPGNNFYVGGRKLTINRIDTAGAFEVESWHFCGECGYVEEKADDSSALCCPRCKSGSWREGSQKKQVARLDRVVADQEEKETRVFDEADQRVPKRFERVMLINYEAVTPRAAYRLNDALLPFGFEYWEKARFRDVNFGEYDADVTIDVAGEKISGAGFHVCKLCGNVGPRPTDDKPFVHKVGCGNYKEETKRGVVECLYLYRKFESEAVRIAIPVNSQLKHSFVAGVRMALQEFYHGNVDHLRDTIRPIKGAGSDVAHDALTIYDEVPGGTGYLKQFAKSPNDFFVALQLALKRLRECPCEQDEEKDGCYRCILRHSRELDVTKIGRKAAIGALSALVKSWEEGGKKLDEIESIEAIDYGWKLESELERMFLDRLEESAGKVEPKFQFERTVVGGNAAYVATFGERRYEILPQKELKKEKDGVAEDSRVDFWIRPLRADASTPPVAVFTDGFEFHGSPTSDGKQLQTDVKQRGAIVRASKPMRVWSLTYKDVERADGSAGSFWSSPFGERTDGVLPERLKYLESRAPVCARRGAFDALLRCLDEPEPEKEPRLDVAAAIALYAAPDRTYSLLAEEDAVAFWDAINDGLNVDTLFWELGKFERARSTAPGACFVSAKRIRGRFAFFTFAPVDPCLLANAEDPKWERIRLIALFDDASPLESDSAAELEEYRAAWNSWLAAFNIFQFLPGAYLTTRAALRQGERLPDWNDALPEERAEGEFGPGDEDWLDAAEEFPAAYELLADAKRRGWEAPETHWDLDDGRRIVGRVAIAWPDAKVFWDEDTKNVSKALELGWTRREQSAADTKE